MQLLKIGRVSLHLSRYSVLVGVLWGTGPGPIDIMPLPFVVIRVWDKRNW